MKFCLTQECQTMTRDYYSRYWQMMREVELADRLGWDSYSLSEQHFTPKEYTTSAPEIFLRPQLCEPSGFAFGTV